MRKIILFKFVFFYFIVRGERGGLISSSPFLRNRIFECIGRWFERETSRYERVKMYKRRSNIMYKGVKFVKPIFILLIKKISLSRI